MSEVAFPAATTAAASATTTATLLKFTTGPFAIAAPVISSFLLRTESFYIRCIGKCQLPVGNASQFALNGIIMYYFFMPVVIGKFHVVRYGIGKTRTFIRIFLSQCFFDHYFQVLSKVRMLGMSLGIRQWLRFFT